MSIGGVSCVVSSVATDKVICTTGARSAGSVDTQVELEVGTNGIAVQVRKLFLRLGRGQQGQ